MLLVKYVLLAGFVAVGVYAYQNRTFVLDAFDWQASLTTATADETKVFTLTSTPDYAGPTTTTTPPVFDISEPDDTRNVVLRPFAA